MEKWRSVLLTPILYANLFTISSYAAETPRGAWLDLKNNRLKVFEDSEAYPKGEELSTPKEPLNVLNLMALLEDAMDKKLHFLVMDSSLSMNTENEILRAYLKSIRNKHKLILVAPKVSEKEDILWGWKEFSWLDIRKDRFTSESESTKQSLKSLDLLREKRKLPFENYRVYL